VREFIVARGFIPAGLHSSPPPERLNAINLAQRGGWIQAEVFLPPLSLWERACSRWYRLGSRPKHVTRIAGKPRSYRPWLHPSTKPRILGAETETDHDYETVRLQVSAKSWSVPSFL